ncbi:hypothetical protein MMC17_006888 [Xylographa soralifera]|nr:hypothetical protein [Xylographa soralifera]MCJ1383774.1 hypothetical protein [Xylographa soralifera]
MAMVLARSLSMGTLQSILAFITIVRAQLCWYPDGKTQAPDSPCQVGAASSCCGQQADGSPAYCLSNGLCLSDMVVSRSSCTDQTWQSSACSQHCQQSTFLVSNAIRLELYSQVADTPNADTVLVPCSNNTWSCDYNCNTATFALPNETFALSSAQKSSLGLAAASATVTVTATATPLPFSNYSSSNAAIGAGVGIPLGVALILMIWLFTHERRKVMHLRSQVPSIAIDSSVAGPRNWPEDRKGKERLRIPNRGASADQAQVMPTVHELRSVTPQFELDARPSSRIRNLLEGRRKDAAVSG